MIHKLLLRRLNCDISQIIQSHNYNQYAAKENIYKYFTFIHKCKRNRLLPDPERCFEEGSYPEMDMFWIVDNVSSIKPLIDVLRLYIKGSIKNIESFRLEIFNKFQTVNDTSTREKGFERNRKLNINGSCHLIISYNRESQKSESLSSLKIDIHEPDRDIANFVKRLLEKYNLAYSISYIEFTFDIRTKEIKFLFPTICRWLRKKNAHSASRCFESPDGTVIWYPWDAYYEYLVPPHDATLYIDGRGSRSWVRLYIKNDEKGRRIRLEFISTRQHLRDSLGINTIEDLFSFQFSQLLNYFEFVEFDFVMYQKKLLEQVEKKRWDQKKQALPERKRLLIIDLDESHRGIYLEHSLQACILKKTKVFSCPHSCPVFRTCRLPNPYHKDCTAKGNFRNTGPELTSDIVKQNDFHQFFRESIEGITIL